MQSSFVVTIRAVLILAAAAVIPAIAVLGTPALQRLRGELPEQTTAQPAQVAAARPISKTPGGRPETLHRPDPSPNSSSLPLQPSKQRGLPPASQAPWYSSRIRPEQGVFWAPEQPLPRGMSTQNAPGPPSDKSVLQGLQEHLKQLGAVYFRLEAFGTSRYRFRCELPMPGNSRYNQHFEATHEDPVTAMRLVVSDVEQWRDEAVARRPGVMPR